MIHPHTALRFISDDVGHGVVATRPIPRGTITWALDPLDRVLPPAEVERLGPLYRERLDHFTFRDNEGRYVLCWDIARYVNHSSRANCLTTAYDFEIAIRDIAPGEQLTDDYGTLNIEHAFECLPEEGTSRTRILPDDLLRFHEAWDGLLCAAFPDVVRVAQPLAPLLPPSVWATAQAIARGEAEMASILTCFYDGVTA
ncbi:MAG: SET domain-containing protein [Rubricoccaceae bacterium]|nr:SET domain-containing protein [Rubricoccaceae bacterium]